MEQDLCAEARLDRWTKALARAALRRLGEADARLSSDPRLLGPVSQQVRSVVSRNLGTSGLVREISAGVGEEVALAIYLTVADLRPDLTPSLQVLESLNRILTRTLDELTAESADEVPLKEVDR